MDTEDIMKLSLKLAQMSKIPEDSLIYVKGTNIKKTLFCIDSGIPELLLAKQLGCDAVIAHHPAGGTAITDFPKVFRRHIEQMTAHGIPEKKATVAIKKKMEQLEIDAHTRNYSHAVDAARLLKMPYLNIHTPLDEVGRRIMSEQITEMTEKNSKVKDVVNALNMLPEFRNAATNIEIRLGKAENLAGKIVVSHGAGTNGGYEVAKTYFEHAIGTIVYIHASFADIEKLKTDGKGNLIVTGHIASDSVGINPFIHELEKQGLEIITLGIVRD